jgi:hypothetical protein
MPTGPPPADHDTGILVRLTGQGGHGRTGSPQAGGRYGLLLLVLIGTYLFSAFNGNGGRAIAVLEALTGQVFLATLVARLVSAYRNPVRPAAPGSPGRRLPEDVDGSGDDEDRD